MCLGWPRPQTEKRGNCFHAEHAEKCPRTRSTATALLFWGCSDGLGHRTGTVAGRAVTPPAPPNQFAVVVVVSGPSRVIRGIRSSRFSGVTRASNDPRAPACPFAPVFVLPLYEEAP